MIPRYTVFKRVWGVKIRLALLYMAELKYLRTDHYVFPMTFQKLGSITYIHVGNPRHRPQPCVELMVRRGGTATLQGVAYHSTCATVPMEANAGTKEMVRAALKYAATAYPHVRRFDVQDETHVRTPTGMHVITPRRLLTGRPGFFQEHFGALPSGDTRDILAALRAKHVCVRSEDWSPDAVIQHAADAGLSQYCLFGTTWTISRATALAYDVTAELADQVGGAMRTRRAHEAWLCSIRTRVERPLRHCLSAEDDQ